MQNAKQSCGVLNLGEIKRPNILRRKINEANKISINPIQNPQSLLLPSGFISDSIHSNTIGTEYNSSNILLHNIIDGKCNNDVNLETLTTPQISEVKSQTKSTPSKRRATQRIVLDTYFCDKNRIEKQKAAEKKTHLENNADKPLVSFHYNPIQDVAALEETSFKASSEYIVPAIAQPAVVAPSLVTLPTDVFPQEFTVQSNDNAASISQSVLLDNNVECQDVLVALKQNSLTEGQLVLLSPENNEESKQMWLCQVESCNTLLNDKAMLDSHILSHFDLKTFTCNIDNCNKTYINEDKFEVHQKQCLVQNNIGAESRAETWEDEKKKARDLITEALNSVGVTEDKIQATTLSDGTKGWACCQPGCVLVFKTQYLLKNHILEHHDLRPFKCAVAECGWAFYSAAKLRVHSEIHTGARKHMCTEPGCCRHFATKSNLVFHMNKVHGGFPCPKNDCQETFPDKVQLKSHINSEHSNICDTCGKKFWVTSSLVVHSCSNITCAWPGCGRVFSQPSRLRYHQRLHTGDKPYRCTFPSCFWAFPSASKLRRHARAHDEKNGRRYACTTCGRAFMRSEHLREHQLRHLPHRQCKCDVPGCEETFANKSSVYVHKKRDHSGTPEANLRLSKRAGNNKLLVAMQDTHTSLTNEDDAAQAVDILTLRSARTHVPWSGGQRVGGDTTHTPQESIIMQHHTGIEEKQGNPLVCGGLELEGGDEMVEGSVGAELCLGDVTQQGVDLNINSLLMQEELSEGMLYTTEDDSALHVLLLNEEPPP